jgi:hypothetical protein
VLGEAASINVTLAGKSVGVLEKIMIGLMPQFFGFLHALPLLESFL